MEVHYTAVLVAAIAHMVLGFLWYGFLFQKPWLKAMGWANKSKQEIMDMQKSALFAHIVSFVGAIIIAIGISNTLEMVNRMGVQAGMMQGAIAWFLFAFTVGIMDYMYAKRPVSLFVLNYAYFFVSFISMGAIVGAWI